MRDSIVPTYIPTPIGALRSLTDKEALSSRITAEDDPLRKVMAKKQSDHFESPLGVLGNDLPCEHITNFTTLPSLDP